MITSIFPPLQIEYIVSRSAPSLSFKKKYGTKSLKFQQFQMLCENVPLNDYAHVHNIKKNKKQIQTYKNEFVLLFFLKLNSFWVKGENILKKNQNTSLNKKFKESRK